MESHMIGIFLAALAVVLAAAGLMLHSEGKGKGDRAIGILLVGLAMCLCIEAGRQASR